MAETQKQTPQKKEVVISYNKKVISLFILAIGALLAFIGLFGTTAKLVAHNGITSACDLSYIFRDGWDLIKDAPASAAKSYNQFILVLLIVSFISAALIACYCIGSTIYFTINKKEINLNRKFAIFSIATLQYPVISTISNYLYADATSSLMKVTVCDTNVGWGTILISIGFFIGLIGLIINETKDKDNLLSLRNIVLKVSIVLFFVICVFASTSLTKYKTSADYSINASSNFSFSYSAYTLLMAVLNTPDTLAVAKPLAIIAFALQTLAVISLFSFVYFAINNDAKKYSKIMIGASSAFLFFTILTSIFGTISLGKLVNELENTKAVLASGVIVTFVLGSLLVFSSVSQLFIKDTTIKFAKK